MTILTERCCKCCEVRAIATAEPVIRYGKAVTLYFCAPCQPPAPPQAVEAKPVKETVKARTQSKSFGGSRLSKIYLRKKDLEGMGHTPISIVLITIGLGQLSRLEINKAIYQQFGQYLNPDRLSDTLRCLVKSGQLEELERGGAIKNYRKVMR